MGGWRIVPRTDQHWYAPQLRGERLTLTFAANGLAPLWREDTLRAQGTASGPGSTTNVVLWINNPVGAWNVASNEFVDGTYLDQVVTNAYRRTNAIYHLLYAYEPDWNGLRQRQGKLDEYRRQGLGDNSREVIRTGSLKGQL